MHHSSIKAPIIPILSQVALPGFTPVSSTRRAPRRARYESHFGAACHLAGAMMAAPSPVPLLAEGCGDRATLRVGAATLALQAFTLAFSVSQNEEFVRLELLGNGFTMDFDAHVFHYLLLTLARQRVVDAIDGVSEGSCGWLYASDLERDLKMDSTLINLHVYRARRFFESRGIQDGARVVERRAGTRELRIGTGRLAITKL